MCHYCGCRQIPLIRDYIAEHERATAHGEAALRAIDHGDIDEAQQNVAAMADELLAHWKGEEDGIFALMRTEELYREHIDPLIAEHRELEQLLRELDVAKPEHQQVLRDQMVELYAHIEKEEDGIFPVTLTEFSGREWDVAIAAWKAAHPGNELIED